AAQGVRFAHHQPLPPPLSTSAARSQRDSSPPLILFGDDAPNLVLRPFRCARPRRGSRPPAPSYRAGALPGRRSPGGDEAPGVGLLARLVGGVEALGEHAGEGI